MVSADAALQADARSSCARAFPARRVFYAAWLLVRAERHDAHLCALPDGAHAHLDHSLLLRRVEAWGSGAGASPHPCVLRHLRTPGAGNALHAATCSDCRAGLILVIEVKFQHFS